VVYLVPSPDIQCPFWSEKLAEILEGIQNHKWNTERFINFWMVVLQYVHVVHTVDCNCNVLVRDETAIPAKRERSERLKK
jgi:hypothetical protein